MKIETEEVEIVEKPWGSETVFADTPEYCGKILTIRAGCSTSIHRHEKKDETLYVLDGSVEVEIFDGRFDCGRWETALRETVALNRGERIRIFAGTWHRVRALPNEDDPIHLIEASTARDERGTVRIEGTRIVAGDPKPEEA